MVGLTLLNRKKKERIDLLEINKRVAGVTLYPRWKKTISYPCITYISDNDGTHVLLHEELF